MSLAELPRPSYFAHPTCVIHDDVEVGPGTTIWQFSSVIRRARLGARCSVASGVIVDGARVGEGTVIATGCFLPPGVEVGAGCFVGPGVKFCNDVMPGHDKDGWYDMEDLISGRVVISRLEDQVVLGAGVIVMPGVTIGRGAMVGAGILVTRDVPPLKLLARDGVLIELDPERRRRHRMRAVEDRR